MAGGWWLQVTPPKHLPHLHSGLALGPPRRRLRSVFRAGAVSRLLLGPQVAGSSLGIQPGASQALSGSMQGSDFPQTTSAMILDW